MDRDSPRSTVVDLAFEIEGATLPRRHRAALALAVEAHVPRWAEMTGASIHRLNTGGSAGAFALLSRRTRLVLRVPRDAAREVAAALDGCELRIGDSSLRVGHAHQRELVPWSTVYAHVVVAEDDAGHGIDDEARFLDHVRAQLDAMGVGGRAICGRRQAIDAEGPSTEIETGLHGFSLMLDQLDSAASIRLMERGLGRHRHLGCGVFVPHKSASAVGAPP